MLERHKKSVYEAAVLLHALKAKPDRFDLLLELQRLIVRRIAWSERASQRSRRCGNELKKSLARDRLPKQRATAVKALIEASARRIDDLRHYRFLWRCFGDGIASIYQSSYSLKHLFFDHKYEVKEDSGFLTGKKGFRREWSILRSGIKFGVPVILSDATNIIRIGDVCALAGSDPFPIEIKSSAHTGGRRARQEQHLLELTAFYRNDGAKLFRGVPNVERVALKLPAVRYESEINACIEQAFREGFSTVQPEPGLRYIVATTSMTKWERLQPFVTRTTLIRVLLPNEGWLPCYPFTLSLAPANLVPFIAGQIEVLVLIDLAHLKGLFATHGITATMIMDGVSAIQISPDPADLSKGVFRISELLFDRVGLEFQSLEWFAAEHSQHFDDAESETINEADVAALLSRGELMAIPDEWVNAKDFWIR